MNSLTRFWPVTALMAWLALILLSTGPAMADTVWFKNGDRLSGQLISLENGKLVLQSPYGGQMSLDWSAVTTVESDHPLLVRDNPQGSEYLSKLQKAKAGHVVLVNTVPQRDMALNQINQFVKPKPRITDLVWTGNADLGVNLDKSSTRTQSYDFSFNGQLSHGQWRHDFGGTYHREKENASVNADNYSLRYSLDHFFTQKFFWQERLLFKRDWVEELSRQIAVGTGPGYQFWDNELGAFSLTLLVGRVNYRYNDSDEDRFTAAGIRWNYQRFIYGRRLELYSRGEFARSLDQTILSLDADTGFRYKLTDWASLNFAYGHDQVSGVREDLNERHFTTGIGVVW